MAGWKFFNNWKNNVIKWWRLIILPVFHIDNNNPKKGIQQSEKGKEPEKNRASECEEKKKSPEDNSDTWWGEAMLQNGVDQSEIFSADTYKVSFDDNEEAKNILKRLEQEQKEQNVKKQQEIEEVRKKAQERERIDSILNANKVNVDEFIEKGMAGRESTSDDEMNRQREMRKAQEIMERLNREAAEDEALKIAEIEKAKEQSKNHLTGKME